MEFGYGLLTAQRPPESTGSYEQVYDEAMEIARAAEASGFDSIWTSEHHFFDDGYAPSVLPFCAAIARETESITVATGMALAPLYHPVRLAEDAATVDLLSNGRFTLGIANGYVPEEFEALDVSMRKRAPRVEDAVEVANAAWTGERFSYDGYTVSLEDVRVQPTPARSGGPPIYIGGVAEAAVRRAGRIADGFLGVAKYGDNFDHPSTMERFERDVELVREERGGSLSGFTPGVVRYANVGDSADEAWTELLEGIRYLQGRYAENRPGGDPDRWEPGALSDRRRDALREGALVGTPESVREQLRRMDDRIPGDLHVVTRLYDPTLSVDEQVGRIERFGRDVIAKFD